MGWRVQEIDRNVNLGQDFSEFRGLEQKIRRKGSKTERVVLGHEGHDLNLFVFHPHEGFDPNSSISPDSALIKDVFPLFYSNRFFCKNTALFMSAPLICKQNI